jgi:hypothetical protein
MLSTLITGLDGRSNFERNGGAIGSPPPPSPRPLCEAETVRRLHAFGIRTSLITGDNEQAALHRLQLGSADPTNVFTGPISGIR